jgi:hypothetical protein
MSGEEDERIFWKKWGGGERITRMQKGGSDLLEGFLSGKYPFPDQERIQVGVHLIDTTPATAAGLMI